MTRETWGIQIVTIQHPNVHGFQRLRNRPCDSTQPGSGATPWEWICFQTGGHTTSMTQCAVTIQIAPVSAPSTPSWLVEVPPFAQVLAHLGLLKAIQERV